MPRWEQMTVEERSDLVGEIERARRGAILSAVLLAAFWGLIPGRFARLIHWS